MRPLSLVKLTALMECTRGRSEVKIGLIDGPVFSEHPDLSGNIQYLSQSATKNRSSSAALSHGTFIAGILHANKGSVAPAICPDCVLLIRPILAARTSEDGDALHASPHDLAAAILECIAAGARIVNLSLALIPPSLRDERELQDALDEAARCNVIVVAAAGNQGILGGTTITRHGWVTPVVAFDLAARLLAYSNLGTSIAKRGLGAPGEGIISLGVEGRPNLGGGTSAAAAFVTGAMALLWSALPCASASEIKYAISQLYSARRTTVVPPLLDAWAAYQYLRTTRMNGTRVV